MSEVRHEGRLEVSALRSWSRLALLSILFVSWVALRPARASEPQTTAVPPGKPIYIGVATLLAGPHATPALGILEGAEAFLKDHPTVLEHPLSLILLDDKCDRETSLQQAKAFCALQPRPMAVVGYLCTPGALAAAKVHGECGLPLLNVSSPDPTLTQAGGSWIARLWFSMSREGVLMAQWVRAKNFRRLVVIRDEDPVSRAVLEVFEAALAGISPRPKVRSIPLGQVRREKAAFAKDKEGLPLAVYIGEGWDLEGLWRDLPGAALGVPWLLDGRAEFSPPDSRNIPQPLEIYRCSLHLVTGDPQRPDFQYFRGRFGEPGVYTLVTYDALSVLLDAFRRVARKDPDGTRWDPAALMSAVRQSRIHGLTGPLSFDPRGDRVQASGRVLRWKEGRWEGVWEGKVP